MFTIGGAATLNGAFNIALEGGFTPSPSDPPLAVVLFASSTGTFSSFSGGAYQLTTNPTNIELAVPTPPPGSAGASLALASQRLSAVSSQPLATEGIDSLMADSADWLANEFEEPADGWPTWLEIADGDG